MYLISLSIIQFMIIVLGTIMFQVNLINIEVIFINNLPRNATGKVLKRDLREQEVGTDAPAIT